MEHLRVVRLLRVIGPPRGRAATKERADVLLVSLLYFVVLIVAGVNVTERSNLHDNRSVKCSWLIQSLGMFKWENI